MIVEVINQIFNINYIGDILDQSTQIHHPITLDMCSLNIRIHRDITGPPKDASGKPARRVV
jgi:hypothetical protein